VYQTKLSYPKNESELRAELGDCGVDPDGVLDPWGVRYRPLFSVSGQYDVLTFYSNGVDKSPNTKDDFLALSFGWPYFHLVGVAIDNATHTFYASTGKYIRDYATLREELKKKDIDLDALRDFLAAPARRLFLAELLSSFTRVASGHYRVQSGGRTRTRRFSELDPVRLAGLLDAVPPAERPGVYRRLGDVTLFLTGVFPDYTADHAFGPVSAARLLRAAQLPADQRDRLAESPAIELLEHLGARWYRAARDTAPVSTARVRVVGDVADRFRQARRVLNHLADRYLMPPGQPWFAQPGF